MLPGGITMLKKQLDRRVDLQRHLFEKGFLITNAKLQECNVFPMYSNFQKTRVFGYDIWVHQGTKLYLYEQNSTAYFLIGHAYNPFSMEHQEEIILKGLAEAAEAGKYTEEIDELTGVFITGIISDESLTVLLDASGMQYGCYGEIQGKVYIASHMRLIGDICGLETDPFVSRLVGYRWYKYMMGNYLPGDLTCFRQVKRIPPNATVQYNQGQFTVRRFYPNRPLDMCASEAEYDSVIEEAAKILKNTMQLIPEKWARPAVSLTGGIDSNTTFAAIAPDYRRYSAFSYVSIPRESVDAEAAEKISSHFGVRHETYKVPEENSAFADFSLYKAIFEHNDGDIGPAKDDDTRKKIHLILNDVCDVEVKSWVSETIRAYAYKYFGMKRFRATLTPRNYTSLYKIFLANRKLVWETDKHFAEYIRKTKLRDRLFNYDETDFFVWEHMHGGKCGLNIGVMKACFDITIPYNNRKLLDLLLRVPLEYRISDKHHLDLKKHMNEELYDMGVRVVNLNQPERRAKILGWYFKLNSILPF